MRRTIPIAVLSAALALVPRPGSAGPASQHVRQADRYYRFAVQALRVGNNAKASEYYSRALRLLPSFPEAHLGMGHIAMSEKRYEDARREYQLARDGYGDVGGLVFELERMRFVEAQSEIANLRDEIRSWEAQMRGLAQRNVSSAYIQRKILELEEQIAQLETIKMPQQGAVLEPPGEIYFYLGNALFHVDRLDDALEAWETCNRKSPKFPLVYNNLAVAYWKKDRIQDALQVVSRAEQLGIAFNPALKADLERSSSQRDAADRPPAAP